MKDKETISAEVLLYDNSDAELGVSRNKVCELLCKSGINIVAQGKRSISVECATDQFEKTFKCSIVERSRNTAPVMDFGPVAGSAFTTDRPPSIPDELKDVVESIYIQTPPTMF